jgi:DNA-binding NtrC family response regulator
MDRILVVEDTDPLRDVLCTVLEREGFSVYGVPTAEAALELLGAHEYACILADFKLPALNGIELLRLVREKNPTIPFVLMTAYGSIEIAVEAMKSGANDFISKPFEPAHLSPMLREVIHHKQIIHREGASREKGGRQILTESPALQKILAQAKQAARVDTSVLILGESGTGKELLARYIHENSPRRDKPFIAVNCAALPPDLLESEFFGHEAGAFTGATQSRAGVLEVASEGTVFLDEVGDMPPSLQVKLLRALQEREIRRVGSTKHIDVSPRILAATNKTMPEAIASGEIREDFFYRIAVVTFTLPPLRERKQDIKAMAKFFVERSCAMIGRETLQVEPIVADILEAYPWPGNVREFENVIERAVILADSTIRPEHLGINIKLDFAALEEASRTLPQIASEAAKQAEIAAIQKVMEYTGGNKSKAAILLGVSYKTLLNKVKEYQLGPVDDVASENEVSEEVDHAR